MYDVKTHSDQHAWKSTDFDGVEMKVLNTNPNTGGLTVLTRMSPGATIPAHHHEESDEVVYVLEGEFIEDGQAHGAGAMFFAAAGSSHGPHRTEQGCVVLTQFSKTLDYVLD